jgi:hypothetical protein
MSNRLVIPAFEGRRGEPWIFKTRHHPDDKKDRIERIVRVALATSAAPTFFQALPNNGYLCSTGAYEGRCRGSRYTGRQHDRRHFLSGEWRGSS